MASIPELGVGTIRTPLATGSRRSRSRLAPIALRRISDSRVVPISPKLRLREHKPPTLIVWGPHDGYMPEASARAYHRDLPDAPLHLLGGGHWLLETHLDEVVPLVADFLASIHAR